jgi:hypothetical protein
MTAKRNFGCWENFNGREGSEIRPCMNAIFRGFNSFPTLMSTRPNEAAVQLLVVPSRASSPVVRAAPTRQPFPPRHQPGRCPCISASNAPVSASDRFERWTAPACAAAVAGTGAGRRRRRSGPPLVLARKSFRAIVLSFPCPNLTLYYVLPGCIRIGFIRGQPSAQTPRETLSEQQDEISSGVFLLAWVCNATSRPQAHSCQKHPPSAAWPPRSLSRRCSPNTASSSTEAALANARRHRGPVLHRSTKGWDQWPHTYQNRSESTKNVSTTKSPASDSPTMAVSSVVR